jgi:hypothetical protein
MEKRSRRRIRDLVALAAFQGLSQNEIGCARISMMARSTNAPCKGRIQKRKTNHLQIIIRLATHGRSIQRCQKRSFRLSRLRQRTRVHSGNPALRRPSISSFEFDCPPRAVHSEIVNARSTSSRRAAASRASASRPRWAKADARQR